MRALFVSVTRLERLREMNGANVPQQCANRAGFEQRPNAPLGRPTAPEASEVKLFSTSAKISMVFAQ